MRTNFIFYLQNIQQQNNKEISDMCGFVVFIHHTDG